MADYRELLRVLENQRPGRAVFFEYTLNQSLAEQLVWRRGRGLWETEAARVQTLADAAAVSGFDCPVAQLSFQNGSFPGLETLRLELGMKLVAGLAEDAGPDILAERFRLLARENKVCAVMIRNVPCGTPALYRQWAEIIHKEGKPCIWTDLSARPEPLEIFSQCKFDAVHLTEAYARPMEELLSRWGKTWALLGDTQFSWLIVQKPKDIISYCENLYRLTAGKGYAFGTGNPAGKPIPYLSYAAILSAYLRGRDAK